MKNLILFLVIIMLGFVLVSCQSDEPVDDQPNLVQNSSLVGDLIDEIKGVFVD